MLLQRVDADEIARLVDDPGFAEVLLFGDEEAEPVLDPRQLDVEKLWHGVHWLLTGTVEETSEGLGAVLMGGVPLGDDIGYGPARLMRPDEVASVYRALVAVPESECIARFDPVAMNDAGVYPQIWDRAWTLPEGLLPALRSIVEQYAVATARGDGLLLALV